MDSPAQLAKQEIGGGVACKAEVNVEAVLEGVSLNIHLLCPESSTDLDVVPATNHVEGI